MHVLQFCADLSKKPKSVKEIYIYASRSSHYTLSENDMAYKGLTKLIKLPQPATLSKKRLWHSCFAVNFAKFLRTPFLTEHLRWLDLLSLN